MAQVSIGRVENLEELARELVTVVEALEGACRAQLARVESTLEEAAMEAHESAGLLECAREQEQAARQAVETARQKVARSRAELSEARVALSACESQREDEEGGVPDCSSEEAAVDAAEAAAAEAEAELEQAQAHLAVAQETRQAMERRVEIARQAVALARQAQEQARTESAARLAAVAQAVEAASARLRGAQEALQAYLDTQPAAAQFQAWLHWKASASGAPITPDMLRDRMNLSAEQQALAQQYLYDRQPAYRRLVDKLRAEWAAAKGDAERNLVARKARIGLSGEFAEQLTRHALAPLGGRVETQGRTYVGEGGRYTKTDFVVRDLHVQVILGRGKGMYAPVGGSLAGEAKCGQAKYLYAQKDHMVFQAVGHRQADAHCTLCSRDIHDLSPEKEADVREALREAGSPLVAMLPRKSEIDHSCLAFIQQGA